MNNSNLFDGITRTEYTVSEGGYKIPHSDFERPEKYYEDIEMPVVGDYRKMLRFKDKNTALFDKRWKAAKEVIDMIAREIDIDPENCGLYLYGPVQRPGGGFESPLVEKMRGWFDKSGDKVKLKKRIAELETQVSALRELLKK